MDTIELDNLIYLIVLGVVLSVWFFVHNRDSLGTKFKQGAAWTFIFIGVIAAVGLWEDVRTTVSPQQSVFSETGVIEVPRAFDGHYYLTLELNNHPVTFVVDTGASGIVLTKEDAELAGLNLNQLSFFNEAMTANGTVKTAPVVLDRVEIGDVLDRNVRAMVNGGQMDKSLLGMSYLQRFDRLEISNGKLVLQR